MDQRTEYRPDKAVQRAVPRTIHFDIFTLFPQMFVGALSESILARAQEHSILQVVLHNIRDYTTDRHHICDGYPYGGGGGMIMKPEPIFRAVESVISRPPGWQLPSNTASDQIGRAHV